MDKDIPLYQLNKSVNGEVPFSLERLSQKTGYNPRSPHRHNYYEIFLFEHGGGYQMIDFQEIEIKAAEIHLLSPGQIHYMRRDADSSGWVIKFTDEFLVATQTDQSKLHYLFSLMNASSIVVEKKLFKDLLNILDDIKFEIQAEASEQWNAIGIHLNLLLLKLRRIAESKNSTGNLQENELCQQFRALIESHYLEENKVSFYTDALNVSDDKLNQCTKKEFGQSPSEMLSDRLLLEAKRFLLHSDQSIKEIAYGLNFQDHAYFNRWFKQKTETSPGDFRKGFREKYHT